MFQTSPYQWENGSLFIKRKFCIKIAIDQDFTSLYATTLWATEKIRELSSKIECCTSVLFFFLQQNYVKFKRDYSVQVDSLLCSQMWTNYRNDNLVKTVAVSSRHYRNAPLCSQCYKPANLAESRKFTWLYTCRLKNTWAFSNFLYVPQTGFNPFFSWGTISAIYSLLKTIFTNARSKVYFKNITCFQTAGSCWTKKAELPQLCAAFVSSNCSEGEKSWFKCCGVLFLVLFF